MDDNQWRFIRCWKTILRNTPVLRLKSANREKAHAYNSWNAGRAAYVLIPVNSAPSGQAAAWATARSKTASKHWREKISKQYAVRSREKYRGRRTEDRRRKTEFLQTSDLRSLTSDLWPPTSDLCLMNLVHHINSIFRRSPKKTLLFAGRGEGHLEDRRVGNRNSGKE